MTASNDNQLHGIKPFTPTRQQIITDRIVTGLASVASVGIIGMLIAALLRLMGLWFW